MFLLFYLQIMEVRLWKLRWNYLLQISRRCFNFKDALGFYCFWLVMLGWEGICLMLYLSECRITWILRVKDVGFVRMSWSTEVCLIAASIGMLMVIIYVLITLVSSYALRSLVWVLVIFLTCSWIPKSATNLAFMFPLSYGYFRLNFEVLENISIGIQSLQLYCYLLKFL